jgi:hypothetical protein
MFKLGSEDVATEDGDGRRKTRWRVPEIRNSILLIQIPTRARAWAWAWAWAWGLLKFVENVEMLKSRAV